MAMNFLTFGNAYTERLNSVTGELQGARHAFSECTRRGAARLGAGATLLHS